MKNTWKVSKSKIYFVIVLLGVFFISCGLEDILIVEAPTVVNNEPLYESEDYLTLYFDFETNEKSDNFSGTDIYYKIYNSSEDLKRERDYINTLGSSSNNNSNSSTAFQKLTGDKNSSNYFYQKLSLCYYYNDEGHIYNKNYFIPSRGSNTRVYFRIKNHIDAVNPNFFAGVSYPHKVASEMSRYDGSYIHFLCYRKSTGKIQFCDWIEKEDKWIDCITGTEIHKSDLVLVEPGRYNGCSFDFFDEDDKKNPSFFKIPENGDDDFLYSSSPDEEDTFFVQFFAVGVVWDADNIKSVYSIPLDLGSVQIKKGQL